jgi:hypothetical protein
VTDRDVMVVQPPLEDDADRPERSLAEQLVERARADGVGLVGPGGLLAGLTKQVLELGLEVEMDEHLGYERYAVEGRNYGNSRNGTRSRRCSPRSARSRSRCLGIGIAASTRRPCAKVSAASTGWTRWSFHSPPRG